MTTNSQLKYKQAISWCDANRGSLPVNCKFKLMSNGHLYKMLEGFNLFWDMQYKCWRDMNAEEGAYGKNGKVQAYPMPAPSSRTLVRIIAHRELIGKRVAEFTELCEALNWRVLKVSDPLGDNGTEFIRVHITITVIEDPHSDPA